MLAEWAARDEPTSTNQKTPFVLVNLSQMHFIQNIIISMNPFCAKSLKTNYNMVPYADHATERVNDHILAVMQLATNGIK